jgi:hypothetical protein
VPGHCYKTIATGVRAAGFFAGTPKKEKEDGQTQFLIQSFVTWTSSMVIFAGCCAGTKGSQSQRFFIFMFAYE